MLFLWGCIFLNLSLGEDQMTFYHVKPFKLYRAYYIVYMIVYAGLKSTYISDKVSLQFITRCAERARDAKCKRVKTGLGHGRRALNNFRWLTRARCAKRAGNDVLSSNRRNPAGSWRSFLRHVPFWMSYYLLTADDRRRLDAERMKVGPRGVILPRLSQRKICKTSGLDWQLVTQVVLVGRYA